MSNSTAVKERPRVDPGADDGSGTDDPEVMHYVRKDAIAKSAVDGDHVVALCGEVFPVTKVAKPGSPVCQACKRIFDKIKP